MTESERELIETAMRKLAPGFVLFDGEAFIKQVQAAGLLYKEKTASRIAREVIRRDDFNRFDCPAAWWWIGYSQLLTSPCGITIDPWWEVKYWLLEEVRGSRKVVNMWGCASSGKTTFMAWLPIIAATIWQDNATGYVTGPWKTASDDKVWKEVRIWARKLTQKSGPTLKALGITKIDSTDSYLRVETQLDSEQCEFKFVAADKAATMQGKKSRSHGSGRQGIMLVECDEYQENPYLELGAGIANILSQENFLGFIGCNPKHGAVWKPNHRRFSEPTRRNTADMRRDRDYRWDTPAGFCVRFDWGNCPNNLLGRDQYKYLMRTETASVMARAGAEDQDAQLWAWAFGDLGANAKTDVFRQERAGAFDDFIFMEKRDRGLSLDPAFSEFGDACVATEFSVGTMQATSEAGEARTVKGISIDRQFPLAVESESVADAAFIRLAKRIAAYRRDEIERASGPIEKFMIPIKEGQTIRADQYLAIKIGELLIERSIPWKNFSFDSSQRADCTDSIFQTLGRQNIQWFYEGTRRLADEERPNWYYWPRQYQEDINGNRIPERWSDHCTRVISMLWFFACAAINRGFVLGGRAAKKGFDELGARQIEQSRGEREDVISKAELKKSGMKSPAYAETLAQAIYFAGRYMDAFDLSDSEDEFDRTGGGYYPDLGEPGEPSRSRYNIRGGLRSGGKPLKLTFR